GTDRAGGRRTPPPLHPRAARRPAAAVRRRAQRPGRHPGPAARGHQPGPRLRVRPPLRPRGRRVPAPPAAYGRGPPGRLLEAAVMTATADITAAGPDAAVAARPAAGPYAYVTSVCRDLARSDHAYRSLLGWWADD